MVELRAIITQNTVNPAMLFRKILVIVVFERQFVRDIENVGTKTANAE
jgi:hypothetical protein